MYEHPSGLPDTFDRSAAFPAFAGLVFGERTFAEGAEHNELQSIMRRRSKRLGDMVARDGDRLAGAAVVIDVEAGRVTLTAGLIYAAGDVRSVAERVIEGVDLSGDVSIGIRIATRYLTAEDEPALYGLMPGSAAEGEPTAAREIEDVSWSLGASDEPGAYYQVYLARGGTVLDQTAPSNLSQIAQQIAAKDRAVTGGNYVIEGCKVAIIGQVGSAMHFAVGAGAASIFGMTRTRSAALRWAETMAWDTARVDAEPHLFEDAGTGTAVIALNRGPVDHIARVLVTKQVTETLTRNVPSGSADPLGHEGAQSVVSVTQGATTYVAGTSWNLVGNAINWSPAGPEPAGGSSYQVTYRYLVAVDPDDVGVQSVTVSGAVTGTAVVVEYLYKLPRVDRLCLNENGEVVYLRGTSSRNPKPPEERSNLLGLADIYNDWRGLPVVIDRAIRTIQLPELHNLRNLLFAMADLVALERLRRDIDSREPVAKRGLFVDPCVDDTYRDQGVPQTAAVFDGSIQLAIDQTLHMVPMTGPLMLDYVEEEIVSQPLRTGCVKINPYGNFTPLPAQLSISPAVDFWTEARTEWLSDITRQIVGNVNQVTETTQVVARRQELAEYLRQIEVDYVIKGFGPGEDLDYLEFDGLDITPDPKPEGDENGEVAGSFTIPADVLAGTKMVYAEGASGARAWSEFTGQGTIDVTVMQRIVSTEVARPPAPAGGNDDGRPQGRGITLAEAKARSDPQAQSFMVPELRHVTGIDVRICAIGDPGNPIAAEIVAMRDGDPTTDTLCSAIVPMTSVAVGERVAPRWPAPVVLTADRMWAFVIKSDDNEHSISVADLGGYDADNDAWVTAHPYPVGPRHSSVNAESWTHHQGSACSFWIWAARFTATTKAHKLGDITLVDASDLRIRATVQLPTDRCALHFELRRAGSDPIVALPNVPLEFDAYLNGAYELWAVLKGTETVSPMLFPGVTVIAGSIRTEGTYVSRAFAAGTGVEMIAYYKTFAPAGATVTASIDKADLIWEGLPAPEIEALNDGWVERKQVRSAISADLVRIKLALTGGPAARVKVEEPRFLTWGGV
ncbi:DUF4815 domain-containing protein [Ancylobacter aquaticus]|nr:DUF4815 domain-containing protein [Ancylobacter aquaticus]